MTTEQRLERLERQNRWAWGIMVVGCAILVLSPQVVSETVAWISFVAAVVCFTELKSQQWSAVYEGHEILVVYSGGGWSRSGYKLYVDGETRGWSEREKKPGPSRWITWGTAGLSATIQGEGSEAHAVAVHLETRFFRRFKIKICVDGNELSVRRLQQSFRWWWLAVTLLLLGLLMARHYLLGPS
ncbi:MAG: hypothetical protein ACYS0K_23015 [Planctomycetota bacterium]